MRIDTLLLDAGSVMVFPNWDRISQILGRYDLIVTPEALRAAEPAAKFAIDTAGSIASSTDADRGTRYLELTFDGAGVPNGDARRTALADVFDYHMAHNIWEHVPDYVFPALDALRGLGLRLAVASNANGVLQRMFDRVGLTPYFHAICDSYVEGVEKPDPRFFQIVLERAGSTPERAMHVGDLYHVDVVGARAAGITPLLVDPVGLYQGFDVDRVRSLADVPALIARSST